VLAEYRNNFSGQETRVTARPRLRHAMLGETAFIRIPYSTALLRRSGLTGLAARQRLHRY
jgi:hypothetical protein